jgi:hypothetical protein
MKKLDDSKIGFSDIPRELRDMIYQHALQQHTPLLVQSTCIHNGRHQPPNGKLEMCSIDHLSHFRMKGPKSCSTKLMQTNQQIRYESRPLFYSVNVFEIGPPCRSTYSARFLEEQYPISFVRHRCVAAMRSLLEPCGDRIQHLRLNIESLDIEAAHWFCEFGASELRRCFPGLKRLELHITLPFLYSARLISKIIAAPPDGELAPSMSGNEIVS